jgi:iron complex transport system substrate-binding protein
MSSIMPPLRGFPAFAAICAISLALFTSVAFGQDTGIESVVEGADARTVVHSAGTAKVPPNPSRVVPLTATLLDMVVSLGITPAAAVTVDEGGFPPYLDEELPGVPAVGDDERPLHEAIIATNPDIIFADPFEAHYDQVNRIAPTVVLNIWLDWKRAFVDMGRILGREQVARQLQNNRLWERVPAVRKGNVYPVPYRTWTCKGITCNTLANRQAFELLTGRSWGDVEQ